MSGKKLMFELGRERARESPNKTKRISLKIYQTQINVQPKNVNIVRGISANCRLKWAAEPERNEVSESERES